MACLENAASRESVLLTGLSKTYRSTTITSSSKTTTASLAIPRRNSPSEAIILWAVVAASPGTTSVEGTYIMPNGAKTAIMRIRSPTSLAVLWIACDIRRIGLAGVCFVVFVITAMVGFSLCITLSWTLFTNVLEPAVVHVVLLGCWFFERGKRTQMR